MARPIEPTPPLSGEDAEEVLRALRAPVNPEHEKKIREAAATYLAEVMRPKGRSEEHGNQ